MRIEIIVDSSLRETRIAVLEDGQLVEYRVEREQRVVGSVYKGIVQNVLPGMDAAFVDIGLERNAFLYVADILPEDGVPKANGYRRNELRARKIKELIRPGQEMMVQVIKGPRGTKGARVSSRIALPGRFLVLTPEANHVKISRKIESRKERDRLKAIGTKIQPEGFGLIFRTECEGVTERQLKSDVDFLMDAWKKTLEAAKRQQAPCCVYQDTTLLYRTVRDLFGDQIDSLVIDDPDVFEKIHAVASKVAPTLKPKIKLYDKDTPIFDQYNIDQQLDKLLGHRVQLNSGAYLVIDEMEALTAIDVNTGRLIGSTSLNETILRANMEAAEEVCRQLRLRDMGGIIVVDFIDMESAQHRKNLLDHFTKKLGKDRARTRVGKISSLGLVELTRKRTAESVTESTMDVCRVCQGRGRVWSLETIAMEIEREMRRHLSKHATAIRVTCHPHLVEALIGDDGEFVEELEHELERGIYIRADFDYEFPDEFQIESGSIEQFDIQLMKTGEHGAALSPNTILECNVRRSALEDGRKIIGWTDEGYYIELINGQEQVGHRAKVALRDIRRSFGVGEVILSSAVAHGRAAALRGADEPRRKP
jgi:ribonuclease G